MTICDSHLHDSDSHLQLYSLEHEAKLGCIHGHKKREPIEAAVLHGPAAYSQVSVVEYTNTSHRPKPPLRVDIARVRNITMKQLVLLVGGVHLEAWMLSKQPHLRTEADDESLVFSSHGRAK